jgi:hypothetical protein
LNERILPGLGDWLVGKGPPQPATGREAKSVASLGHATGIQVREGEGPIYLVLAIVRWRIQRVIKRMGELSSQSPEELQGDDRSLPPSPCR